MTRTRCFGITESTRQAVELGFRRKVEIVAGIPGDDKNAAKHHSCCKFVLDKFDEEVMSGEDGEKRNYNFQSSFETILIQIRCTSSSRILC